MNGVASQQVSSDGPYLLLGLLLFEEAGFQWD